MRFFVTCPRGTEGALRRELVDLRIHAPRGATGGVSFEGSFDDGMRVCLWSRVAMRVLLELASFEASDADGLYEAVRAVTWHEHITPAATLAVSAHAQDNPALTHSGFVALKVKDAIVDAVRDRAGTRPNVAPHDPDVAVFVHLSGNDGRVYLDLSGEPLHRRGYRVAMTDAPLKENLAAAVLALGGIAPDAPFVDPMCGSGTLAIEQALRARDLAPGLDRRFGFERWPTFQHAAALAALRDEARARARARAPAPILARDVNAAAVEATRRNARAAHVDADLRIEQGDVRSFSPSGPPGSICLNPPYGVRLAPPAAPAPSHRGNFGRQASRAPSRSGPGHRDASRARSAHGRQDPSAVSGGHGQDDSDEMAALYDDLGRLLAGLRGWHIAILSGNPLLARALWRKPDVSHKLWNGALETRLLVWRVTETAG